MGVELAIATKTDELLLAFFALGSLQARAIANILGKCDPCDDVTFLGVDDLETKLILFVAEYLMSKQHLRPCCSLPRVYNLPILQYKLASPFRTDVDLGENGAYYGSQFINGQQYSIDIFSDYRNLGILNVHPLCELLQFELCILFELHEYFLVALLSPPQLLYPGLDLPHF